MLSARAADLERTAEAQLVLENGLQAVWEEDHRQPLVAIEVRIRGGLRGEGPYVGTGITHFIEHLLFKGTPTRPPGSIEQEVRRYGGTINAFTSMDATGITLFVESRYASEALGMVADILQHAVFDPEEVEKERAVITREIDMKLDDPHYRVWQLLWSRHFLEHPYGQPTIGHASLLQQITVEEIASLYRAQYQPQNITIGMVGDLDGAGMPQLVRAHFGDWPRGRIDPQQVLVAQEPPTASAKRAEVERPVQTAYVMLGVTSTRLADPDLYPLDVLASILGHGRSARLYETLVRKRRLIDAVHAFNYTPYDPGLFAVQFRADPDRVEEAIDGVLELLDAVGRDGVSEEELAKAKRQVIADYYLGRQTIEARAADLASSMSGTGDPGFSQRYVQGIQQVTAAEVQDASRRYVDRARMTIAILRPEGTGVAQQQAAPVAEVAMHKVSLGNGATVILGEDHRLPLVTVVAAFRGGVRIETEETQGLSNLVAHLLTKGTAGRSASEIAQWVESLGGTLEPFSGGDGFGLSLQLLSEDVEAGLRLIHELVSASTFPEEELEIQRELILKELAAQEDEIFIVGGRLLRQTLFPRHPYRFHRLGSAEALERISRESCRTFASQWVTPTNMVVSVMGDLSPQQITPVIEKTFGRLRPSEAAWPEHIAAEPLTEVRQAARTVSKEQAVIMMGFRGSTHHSEDRDVLDVMTAVFSGMAGRLFQSVREDEGLSYTLGAVNVTGWDPGFLLFYAATAPSETARVAQGLEREVQRALDDGFTIEEVDEAKRYLIGHHRMDVQSLVGLAKRATLDELYGLGYDAWRRYEDDINAVSRTAVQAAAQRYLTLPQRAQVVVSPDGHAE